MRLNYLWGLLVMFLVVSCTSCNTKRETDIDKWNSKTTIVKEALERLLKRTNDDCFVIFSEESSGNFVQFAQNDKKLIFDLPEDPLNEVEMNRAKVFLKNYGIQPEKITMYQVPDWKVIHCTVFSHSIGQDVDLATEITIGIFAKVYMMPPDFKLDIQEN